MEWKEGIALRKKQQKLNLAKNAKSAINRVKTDKSIHIFDIF